MPVLRKKKKTKSPPQKTPKPNGLKQFITSIQPDFNTPTALQHNMTQVQSLWDKSGQDSHKFQQFLQKAIQLLVKLDPTSQEMPIREKKAAFYNAIAQMYGQIAWRNVFKLPDPESLQLFPTKSLLNPPPKKMPELFPAVELTNGKTLYVQTENGKAKYLTRGANARIFKGTDQKNWFAIKLLPYKSTDHYQKWMRLCEAFRESVMAAKLPHYYFLPSVDFISLTHTQKFFHYEDNLLLMLVPLGDHDLDAEFRKHKDHKLFHQLSDFNYIKYCLIGLERLHKAGIHHNDIKPQNILVDSKKLTFLIDFGFWVPPVIQDTRTMYFHSTKIIGGTFPPPECIDAYKKRRFDHVRCDKIDSWAIGCIILHGFGFRKDMYRYSDLHLAFSESRAKKDSEEEEEKKYNALMAHFTPLFERIRKMIDKEYLNASPKTEFEKIKHELGEVVAGCLDPLAKTRWSVEKILMSKFFQRVV